MREGFAKAVCPYQLRMLSFRKIENFRKNCLTSTEPFVIIGESSGESVSFLKRRAEVSELADEQD